MIWLLIVLNNLCQANPPPQLWLWSENHTITLQDPWIKVFQKNNFGLIRSLRPLGKQTDLQNELSILQNLRAMGISVRPWILLPKEDGYWSSAYNVDVTIRAVNELLQYDSGLDEVVLDFETPLERLNGYLENVRKFKFRKANSILRNGLSHAEYLSAIQKYNAAFEDWKNKGVKIRIVAPPLIALNKRAEEFLGLPVSKLNADSVSFMVYRSEYQKFFPKVDSNFTKLVSDKSKDLYPQINAIDIGIFGHFDFPEYSKGLPYEELSDEMAAVTAPDLNEIHVYSLDNIIRDNNLVTLEAAWVSSQIDSEKSNAKALDQLRWGFMKFAGALVVPLKPRK